MNLKEFSGMFDHTNLKADASAEDFKKLCTESADYGFAMIAINSFPVALCKMILRDTLKNEAVHIGAAIAFPLGQCTIEAKAFETKDAIQNGANEIDYVLNIAKLKARDYKYIKHEMETIVGICHQHNVISKVIFENCYLTEEEIRKAAEIALEVKPDYIKTSTGFGTYGARACDVKLMKSVVGDAVKVKAAGGIRDLDTALALIDAGAERLGSSCGVPIVEEFKARFDAK